MKKLRKRPTDDYEVGYAKPPRATQFNKGQSGNPSGRPRRGPIVESDEEIFLRFVSEKVLATKDGRQVKITKWHALVERVLNEGGRGAKARELALQFLPFVGNSTASVVYVEVDEKLSRI